jgi:hypothetical protein
MAIADLVACGEMLALNKRRWHGAGRLGHKCIIDGTSGSNGSGYNIFDEVTSCLRHSSESS